MMSHGTTPLGPYQMWTRKRRDPLIFRMRPQAPLAETGPPV